MIQRIQSVYLLLTFLLSVLFLSGDFFSFINPEGTEIILKFNGLWRSADAGRSVITGNHYFLTVIIVLIALLSAADIFLYGKRRLQIMGAKILIVLAAASVVLTVYYLVQIPALYEVTPVPGIRIIIPPLILILCLLAHRGIRKDEELVRSYDRIR